MIIITWLSVDCDRYKEQVDQMNSYISDIEQMKYNDSTLLNEYQNALDSFTTVNPKAAEQFMLLIENENE